jgi:hypothetical protein
MPSIVAGRLVRVSVSQIKTFSDCSRKWWYDKAAGLDRKAESKNQKIGKAGHTRLQHFANTGEDVRGPLEDCGPAAERLDDLVDRSGGWEIYAEQSIENLLTTPGGVVFVGSIDLLCYFPPGLEDAPEIDNTAVIVDHKYRGDIEAEYVEDAESLPSEPQMIVYAAAVFKKYPKLRSLKCEQHNYQHTGKKQSSVVWVTFKRAEIEEKFSRLCALVDGPMQLAAATDLHTDVDPTTESCTAFGGCDFALTCPAHPQRAFALALIKGYKAHEIRRKPSAVIDVNATQPPTKDEPKMATMLERLAQKQANAETPAPAAVVAAITSPVATVTAAHDVKPDQLVKAAAPGGVVASQAVKGGLYITSKGEGRCEAVTPAGVYFETVKGDPIKVPVDEVLQDITDDRSARKMFGLMPVPIKDVPSEPNAGEVRGAGSAVNPPNAPRAPKNPEDLAADLAAENATTAPVVAAAASAVPAAVAVEKPKKTPKAAKAEPGPTATVYPVAEIVAPAGNGITLLINCFTPGAKDLSGYVAGLANEAAEACKSPDLRIAGNDTVAGYGKWPGVMASLVREKKLPAGVYFTERSQLSDPVIEALIPMCSTVVRGF